MAEDADVSTYVIRDYELRGLLSPCKCMTNGYRIYDEHSLNRLQFVLAGKAAGIPYPTLLQYHHYGSNPFIHLTSLRVFELNNFGV